MAWARWLLPLPGGPETVHLAARDKAGSSQVEDQAAIHLPVEGEVEVVEGLLGVAELRLFFRRSSKRSPRRASSSETRQESKSMGASGSAWAWRRRVSSTAAIPPRRSCLRARSRQRRAARSRELPSFQYGPLRGPSCCRGRQPFPSPCCRPAE